MKTRTTYGGETRLGFGENDTRSRLGGDSNLLNENAIQKRNEARCRLKQQNKTKKIKKKIKWIVISNNILQDLLMLYVPFKVIKRREMLTSLYGCLLR